MKVELKDILKPLIKVCIKEVILEEGVLSNIIKETINGMKDANILVEQRTQNYQNIETPQKQAKSKSGKEIVKEMMLKGGRQDLDPVEKINKLKSHSALGKLFEGTTPLPGVGVVQEPGSINKVALAANPLRDIDPNDPGIDLSIFSCFNK